MVEGEEYEVTPGLWELLVSKDPKYYTDEDEENYTKLMLKTNALHRDNNPGINKSSKSYKWTTILSPIWYGRKKYEGEGVVVIPSDPKHVVRKTRPIAR